MRTVKSFLQMTMFWTSICVVLQEGQGLEKIDINPGLYLNKSRLKSMIIMEIPNHSKQVLY